MSKVPKTPSTLIRKCSWDFDVCRVFFLLSKIMIENVLCFKLSLSFFHFMRNCKKQENKNQFGGTLCINLIINAKTGPKDVDRVNEIYKNEND